MPAHEWTDTSPHPWRRYAARIVDTTLFGTATAFVVSFIYTFSAAILEAAGLPLLPDPWRGAGESYSRLFDVILTLAMAIPANAFFIGTKGVTPGKWIFGVRVTRDGSPIGFAAALRRELDIWVRGWAFGLPIISLATLIFSDRRLTSEHATLWDEHHTVTHRPPSTAAMIGMWSAVVGVVIVQIWMQVVMTSVG